MDRWGVVGWSMIAFLIGTIHTYYGWSDGGLYIFVGLGGCCVWFSLQMQQNRITRLERLLSVRSVNSPNQGNTNPQ
jgi:hypothetical protein